jgi:hypothetical protein
MSVDSSNHSSQKSDDVTEYDGFKICDPLVTIILDTKIHIAAVNQNSVANLNYD